MSPRSDCSLMLLKELFDLGLNFLPIYHYLQHTSMVSKIPGVKGAHLNYRKNIVRVQDTGIFIPPGTKYIGVYSFCLFCNYVCLSVCLSVNFFFRQRFLSNYLG